MCFYKKEKTFFWPINQIVQFVSCLAKLVVYFTNQNRYNRYILYGAENDAWTPLRFFYHFIYFCHVIPKHSSVWYSYIAMDQFILTFFIFTFKLFIQPKMNCILHLTHSDLSILLSQLQHYFFPCKLSLKNFTLRIITLYFDLEF